MSQRGAFGLGDGLRRRMIAENDGPSPYDVAVSKFVTIKRPEPRHEGIIELIEGNGVWMKPDEA